MALWALTKLLHPFTPDDLLESQKIVSSLHLPACTSQFVLALRDPQTPGNVVYILAVEKLSERSVGDIHALVSAANPSAVVAFVDAECVVNVVEEQKLLDAAQSLDVPTSVLDVVKSCFADKIKANVYESRAGLRVLTNVFGTTFYGNVYAAKEAAKKSNSIFEYLRFPSIATTAFSDEEEDAKDGDSHASTGDGQTSSVSYADSFLRGLSVLLGGSNNVDNLTVVSSQTMARSSPYYSNPLRPPAPPLSSALASNVATSSVVASVTDSGSNPSTGDELSEDVCPSFAAPFYLLFVDLHGLYKEMPGMNQALNFARKLLNDVERGEEVDHQDLSQARLFRVAVESVRLSWNSFTMKQRKESTQGIDFSQLPFEEKCQALLAKALQHQAQKFNTVVAIVDASMVHGIRKHWKTPVPPEVAAYAEYCLLSLDSEEIGGGRKVTGLLENPEAKAAVVVGAGAAAVGLVSLSHWAPLSTFMKVFTFKVPAVLKLVWLQMKRNAFVSLAKAITPVSKLMVPAIKAAGSGNTVLAPSSTAKAIILKSASAEKVRATAHGMVAAAERASLQAIRTAFYSLMRNKQAKTLGPRPWVALGSSVAAGACVWYYGEEVEHAISITPSVPAVARLGRGLEHLDRASHAVSEYENSSWWDGVYDTLYRQFHHH